MADDLQVGLERLENKMSAVIALLSRQQLLLDGPPSGRRPRPIDVVLADVGLSTTEIGKILGKSDRAVRLVLEGWRKKKGAGDRGEH